MTDGHLPAPEDDGLTNLTGEGEVRPVGLIPAEKPLSCIRVTDVVGRGLTPPGTPGPSDVLCHPLDGTRGPGSGLGSWVRVRFSQR